jgi:hypothetical protein
MNKFIALLILVASLTTFGLGCAKKQKAASENTQPDEFALNAWLPPSAPSENENARNLRELRESLDSFRNAKSFRAKLSIDNKDGNTTGQISVMKPDRFSGTLNIPKEKQTAEIIGVGETVYVKMPQEIWIPIRSQALSTAMKSAFRTSIDGDNDVLQKNLPDESIVVKSKNTANSCDRYSTTIKENKSNVDISVCVENGLPKQIEVTAEQGSFRIDYYDYNELFTIERPTIPEAFRTALPK